MEIKKSQISLNELKDFNLKSFHHASQIFLEKINHNFCNKNVIEPLLSKYIKEFIEICMIDGGLVYKKRGSSLVLIYNSDIETKYWNDETKSSHS